MEFYNKFVENPQFLKWIYSPDYETINYWEKYIKSHPGEKNEILKIKNELQNLKFSNLSLSENENKELSNRILKSLGIQKQKTLFIHIKNVLKYAAIALLFFSLGGVLVYNHMNNQIPAILGEQINSPIQIQKPTLFLQEGENIPLNNNSSSLDYSNPGKIVLDKDTIINTSKTHKTLINQLVIPYGNRSKILLSDNTEVWLNAGSRLIYPSDFKGNRREVMLFGEAFFKVAENPDKPFIVKTSSIEVRVLGTMFNISAYPEDDFIQTVLQKGSIAIRQNGAQFFEKDLLLKPNQLASFNKKTKTSKIFNVDANYYSIWTEGLLSFYMIDLNRIIKKIERYYNIRIKITDPMLGIVKISGKLDLEQDINEVFEYISKVSSAKIVKIEGNYYEIK